MFSYGLSDDEGLRCRTKGKGSQPCLPLTADNEAEKPPYSPSIIVFDDFTIFCYDRGRPWGFPIAVECIKFYANGVRTI